MIKQAVVLAAGEGQRLRPFTATKPKVMIKVANKPILEHVVSALRAAGIFDIIMVVGYRKERIMDYFGDGSKFGVKISYAFQNQQLGTAHALKQAEGMVDDSFILLPGDNIVDASTVKSAITEPYVLVYKRVKEISKYGAIVLENGRVREIVEKPKEEISHLANTGIYSLDMEVFEKIGKVTSIVEVLNRMIVEGYRIRGVECSGKWYDVVYPWDILRVNDLAMEFEGKRIGGKVEPGVTIYGNVVIGDGAIIRSGTYIRGPVVIGDNCEIGPNAVIHPSTSIGDNVSIGPFSVVSNSVIGDNVKIGGNCHVEDSVVDSGTVISSHFAAISDETEVVVGGELHRIKAGVFVGEDCNIGASVCAEPGSVVGNRVNVSPLKVLRGNIPDGSTVL